MIKGMMGIFIVTIIISSPVLAANDVRFFTWKGNFFKLGAHKFEIERKCGEPISKEDIGFVSTKYQ